MIGCERVVRVGVTGHRAFEDPLDHVAAGVTAVLSNFLRLAGGADGMSPPRLEVLSALAEGADRLVAEAALQVPGAALAAVLPFPVEEYERDFEAAESRLAFRDLLARARRVEIMPATFSREEGYERQGRWIVDRSDALAAIWDGAPSRGRGGTGEIVAYAADRAVPILWVRVKRPGPRA